MAFDFSAENRKPLCSDHSATAFTEACNFFWARSMEDDEYHMAMSSANMEVGIMVGMSSIAIRNRVGEITLPCGNPFGSERKSESS